MIVVEINRANCYDKNIIEPFALSTIAKSFDAIYADYRSPESTDNLDYISPDGSKAIEITTVIPNNVIGGFVYDKALSKGKNPSPNKIKKAKVDASGNLLSFYGGSMSEIRRGIIERIEEKNDKVIKRKIKYSYKSVDLCICIADGSLFDLYSFQTAFCDLQKYVFDNIFFITPSYFIRFDKINGFQEYRRII